MKVVLVTGAAGFIGSHVADALLTRGDFVVAVDEINDYYNVKLKEANVHHLLSKHGSKFKFYKGDICDSNFMTSIFESERITHVCHLAARAGVRPSVIDPYIYLHSNIEGTTRLLDLSHQYSIQNFVFASSSSVYGSSTKEFFSETDSVARPLSPYAATKKACELLAHTWHHLYGLNCTGLRFFTVYGPRGRPDMAPFKFIDRIFNSLPIQQYGDGSTSRDYTYIDDIVNGVVRAIDRPLGYEIFNLGNGQKTKLKDFISLVETHLGKKANIEILPKQLGDVEMTCANVSKAKYLLGYIPQISPDIGIRRTVHWYKVAHKEGLFRVENNTKLVTTTTNETSSSFNQIVSVQFPISFPSSLKGIFNASSESQFIDALHLYSSHSPNRAQSVSMSNTKKTSQPFALSSQILQQHQLFVIVLLVIISVFAVLLFIVIRRKRSKVLILSSLKDFLNDNNIA